MSNHRASLLTGLRTGGPRSVSSGTYNAPQTAAFSGHFPRHASSQFSNYAPDQAYDADDHLRAPMTAIPFQDAFTQQTQLMLLQAQAQTHAFQNNGFPATGQEQLYILQFQMELYKMQVCTRVPLI
jgi:hypothetical protein